ncbi:hypothetical protein BDW02DRAFT_568946 [Decorospora gaudefroyi]|uniref:GmrSD restriction endonucleases N-terminal domain-containing protein n=1 Tax=Decorospora gaudefroyi TaxID=184978 RepID=A0A6A5KEZ4_9PLEO|nr:hypothetical protein BDW02DRAFT_568946 [Decorospora gaudefroyi]
METDGPTNNQTHNDVAHQPFVKEEIENSGSFFGDSDSDSDDEEIYKPRPQLPQPNVHMRSLADLIKDLENGAIDVNPEYQREVVWTTERMTGLVNSLMENYYIPPIILNQKKNIGLHGGQARDTLVCVDGKQRLSSVLAFVKGMIPCHDCRGEKWWFFAEPKAKRKKILPDATQKLFLNKDFVAFQFTELTQEQEEDLFARVQMGVTLTAAEKMRAQSGPWQELAKLFVEDFANIYSLMKDRARAKDFQLTLACFSQVVEVMHPTAANGIPQLKTSHSALPKFLSNKGAVDDTIKSHLASIWNTFKELIEQDSNTFINADKHLRGVQTFAPVEMVAVTVMISMYSETRNNQLLLGDIRALRESLRDHFADLRLNPHVWKFIWEFLEDLEAIRGAVDGSTVNRKQPEQRGPYPSSATATRPSASSTSTQPRGGRTSAIKSLPSLPLHTKTVVKREEVSGPSSVLPAPKRQRIEPIPGPQDMASAAFPMFINPGPQSASQQRSPSTAQQNSVSVGWRGYRAPTAPMQPSKQLFSASSPTHKPAICSSNAANAPNCPSTTNPPRPSSTGTGVLRQSAGAFTPPHTDEEWQGILKSISPVTAPRAIPPNPLVPAAAVPPPPASTTHPVPPPSNNKKRKSVTPLTAAQYNGIIDLTGDTDVEEERQSLLSSFKGRSVAGKQRQVSTTPATIAPVAKMESHPVTVQDLGRGGGKSNGPE